MLKKKENLRIFYSHPNIGAINYIYFSFDSLLRIFSIHYIYLHHSYTHKTYKASHQTRKVEHSF